MKNKDKIIILKAEIIKLKKKLKEARLELADRDNEIDRLNLIINAKPTPTHKEWESNPIESTQELFEGKGYVYYVSEDGGKKYFSNIQPNGLMVFSHKIEDASKLDSLISFKDIYKEYDCINDLNLHFEPIQ